MAIWTIPKGMQISAFPDYTRPMVTRTAFEGVVRLDNCLRYPVGHLNTDVYANLKLGCEVWVKLKVDSTVDFYRLLVTRIHGTFADGYHSNDCYIPKRYVCHSYTIEELYEFGKILTLPNYKEKLFHTWEGNQLHFAQTDDPLAELQALWTSEFFERVEQQI